VVRVPLPGGLLKELKSYEEGNILYEILLETGIYISYFSSKAKDAGGFMP